MRSIVLSLLAASTVAIFAQGCAAESSSNDESTASDLTALSQTQSEVLADLLTKANAPSNTPAGIAGVGSHIARIHLETAQGGMAHFISQSGSVSTVDGAMLSNIIELGGSWSSIKDALVAGGASFATVDGDHGSSSSTLFAEVECKQVVSPTAHPTCTVKPVTMTQGDHQALMTLLVDGHAPSTNPAGSLGSDDLAGKLELTFAQGGTAHFISQGGSLSTLAGKKLDDVVDLGVAWKSLETALLDAGLTWTTTNGPHMSSTSTMSASISCHRVVAPQARAICAVSAL